MKRIASFTLALCRAFSLLYVAASASGEASGSASGISSQIAPADAGYENLAYMSPART